MPHIHWVARHPVTMVVPLTPKPTRKAEALARAPPIIPLCHEEDDALRKWSFPRYCCVRCILETKTNVGSTTTKAPTLRTHPNIDEATTAPKSNTHPSHEFVGRARDPETMTTPPTPKPICKTVAQVAFLKLKQKSEAPQRKTRSYVPTRKSMSLPPHPNHPPTYPTLEPPSHQPRLHP